MVVRQRRHKKGWAWHFIPIHTRHRAPPFIPTVHPYGALSSPPLIQPPGPPAPRPPRSFAPGYSIVHPLGNLLDLSAYSLQLEADVRCGAVDERTMWMNEVIQWVGFREPLVRLSYSGSNKVVVRFSKSSWQGFGGLTEGGNSKKHGPYRLVVESPQITFIVTF